MTEPIACDLSSAAASTRESLRQMEVLGGRGLSRATTVVSEPGMYEDAIRSLPTEKGGPKGTH